MKEDTTMPATSYFVRAIHTIPQVGQATSDYWLTVYGDPAPEDCVRCLTAQFGAWDEGEPDPDHPRLLYLGVFPMLKEDDAPWT